ncbi:MAG: BatA and WFA domain-containing protein, partial [Pirellulales bacterium]
PKKILFPALRFVRETAITAERGWKAKHWLLMALRALLIGIVAFAFAAPRVHSEMLGSFLSIGILGCLAVLATMVGVVAYASKKPATVFVVSLLVAVALWLVAGGWASYALIRGKPPLMQNASGPIAVALVVDTGPTMEYRSDNQSRMEVAKEMGEWLIDRLPPESEIAIVTTDQGLRLSTDRVTAQRQLQRVQVEGKAAPLIDRMNAALDLVKNSKLERREIYLLTDLRTPGWQGGSTLRTMEDPNAPPVLIQLIDVGTEKSQNWSLVETKLSQQSISPGGSVDLEGVLVASAETQPQQVTVELWAEKMDPTLPVQRNGKTIVPDSKLVERQVVEIGAGARAPFRFTVRDLTEGTQQLQVRIGNPDPLAIDNTAYASIDVRDHSRTLLVCDDVNLSLQVMAIVDPQFQVEQAKSSKCERVDAFRVDTVDFDRYSCVIFLDPPALPEAIVERLDHFVRGGGGLLMLLGPRLSDANRIQSSPISKLFPGKVEEIRSIDPGLRPTTFVPKLLTHPIFHPLEKLAEEAPWALYPIRRYWRFSELHEQASVLVQYTQSNDPAILDEARGQGKILTWTTPIPEPSRPEGRDAWNQLWNATDDPWPNFGLLFGSIRYLSGWGKQQLNYRVGQTAQLELDSQLGNEAYELFGPRDEISRLVASGGVLTFPYTKSSGAYRLRSLGEQKNEVLGFAVNISEGDLQLDRVSSDQLEILLGKGRYRIAKKKDEVETSIGQARFGSELYPFLVLIAALLLIAEQAMSSRFYTIRF